MVPAEMEMVGRGPARGRVEVRWGDVRSGGSFDAGVAEVAAVEGGGTMVAGAEDIAVIVMWCRWRWRWWGEGWRWDAWMYGKGTCEAAGVSMRG